MRRTYGKRKSEHFEKAKAVKKKKDEIEKEKRIEENNKVSEKKGPSRLGRNGYYDDNAISMVQKSKRR